MRLPVDEWLPDLVVGVAALILAVWTWRGRRAVSTQALLFAALWWAGTAWTEALYWHRGPLILVALAVPLAWPRTRIARLTVAGGLVVAFIGPLWYQPILTGAVAVAVVVAGAVEARNRRAKRYLVAPLLVATALMDGVLLPPLLGEVAGPVAALVSYDALVTVTLVVVAALARTPSRFALTDLAVDVGPAGVVDARTLAGLVTAEPGLAVDADLQAALGTAQRLEAANERARADVREALADVDRSRRRLLVASASERARLAEELEQSVAAPLRELARTAPPDSAGTHLARAVASLDAALAGLRPPDLAHGLARALEGHPLVATLHAEVQAEEARCDEVTEDTLYAVASEALSNIAKHAGPCQVAVRFELVADRAVVTVVDDGLGGAVLGGGSGLTGLTDAVEALGGSLTLLSPPGAGTSVTASVPLAVPGAGHRHLREADTQAGSGNVGPSSMP
jgi:signal transduction histidine kinase